MKYILEPHTLELSGIVAPKSDAMLWGFAQWLFRGDRVRWESPVEVNWLGRLMSSPFEPLEEDIPEDLMCARRKARVTRAFVIGDPVCFLVRNSTDQQVEVKLVVEGVVVKTGEYEVST